MYCHVFFGPQCTHIKTSISCRRLTARHRWLLDSPKVRVRGLGLRLGLGWRRLELGLGQAYRGIESLDYRTFGLSNRNRDARPIYNSHDKCRVQNRCIVSIKDKQEVVCALSNGDIDSDLALSSPQPLETVPFCNAFHTFIMGKVKDFKFGALVGQLKYQPRDYKLSPK